jgi:hypothetical protein
MTLRNPKIFGLNVLSFLSDIENKNIALTSINLSSLDLDVIRGSSNAGATKNDWVSFSRLKTPIYKTLDRFYSESNSYLPILKERAGIDSMLFGNLKINGSLSGNSIRYRYVNGTGPSATVKIADISTSKVSAWSSSESPVIDTSPIFYGARVGITTGGALQFGIPNSESQTRIKTSIKPQLKEFDSEFPTSKINFTINGKTVTLYAMKGIPLIFKGFFRNLDASISLTELIDETPASWKIVNASDSNLFIKFENIGGTTSQINYRSTVSIERYIQFYYNPDNILSITLNSANISELPITKLSNAKTLNFSSNSFKNFPDFNFFSPNLKNLYISYNSFYLSETQTERKLNINVLNKIPKDLLELVIGSNFYGTIPVNAIANRFTKLTRLDLSRGGGGPYFHPDNDDPDSKLPNVPNTCETYNVSSNDFRKFESTDINRYNIKDLTNLVSLDLSYNYYLTDSNFSIEANTIQFINISNTGLQIPDLSIRSSLTTFYGYYLRNSGSIFTSSGNYKFDGCSSLSTLYLYYSNITGPMPKFTNASLSYLELRGTALTGGDPDNKDNTYVIPEKTFEKSPNIQYFLYQSGNTLLNAPIHPNVFRYTPNLYYLWYISYGRTNGNFPSISSCSNLTYLVLHYNSFSGNAPNLATNLNIYYVDLSYNQFSGTIPKYKNLSNLTYLFLYNNNFTGLNKFENLPSLTYFYAHNNQLEGEIPDFSDCPNLYYLILFNNKFRDYKSGAFSKIYRLKYLDISNNNLTSQAVNQIIKDLVSNYNTVNRGDVTINLRGNSSPSGEVSAQIDLLRSKGWSIVYDE